MRVNLFRQRSLAVGHRIRPYLGIPSLALTLLLFAACAAPMLPEDCYADERYDADAQLCYPACEDDDSCAEFDDEGGAWLDDFVALLTGGFGGNGDGEQNLLITYMVDGDAIIDPQPGEAFTDDEDDLLFDDARHQQIWDKFANLIPQEDRVLITQYALFTDGMDENMAYVEPLKDAPTNWLLAVDGADADNEKELLATLIHEFGHVLTLNNAEVPYDREANLDDEAYDAAENACPTFFTGEGCSQTDSYINAFYQQFWAELADEHNQIDPEDDDALYDFYQSYADRFVSDYAATNPGEDITESWTHFVLKRKPTGQTVADQKALFFYAYPELVELRAKILAQLRAESVRSQ